LREIERNNIKTTGVTAANMSFFDDALLEKRVTPIRLGGYYLQKIDNINHQYKAAIF